MTRTTGCWTSSNKLSCLRNLTSDQLYQAQVSQQWNPIVCLSSSVSPFCDIVLTSSTQVDGDFLTDYPSSLAPQGKFIKVPLLTGANNDEGSSFGISGLDNETAIFNSLLWYRASNAYALSPPTARKLLELYPVRDCLIVLTEFGLTYASSRTIQQMSHRITLTTRQSSPAKDFSESNPFQTLDLVPSETWLKC